MMRDRECCESFGCHFWFDERRAVQAASFLVRLRWNGVLGLPVTSLLKLLYLADRRSLRETGAPIAGAGYIITQDGPVSQDLLFATVRAEGVAAFAYPYWGDYVMKSCVDGIVSPNGAISHVGDDDLSEYDETVLSELHTEHRGSTTEQLIAVSKDLPEFRRIVEQMPSIEWSKHMLFPLSVDDILIAQGISEQEIEQFKTRNEHVMSVMRTIERLGFAQ